MALLVASRVADLPQQVIRPVLQAIIALPINQGRLVAKSHDSRSFEARAFRQEID